VTTDDEGRFTFELAAGEWRLNRIHTTAWSDKPDSNDFTLIGSAHPKLTEKLYNESLDWPDREAVSATLTDDVICWQPVENAVSYQVQLQEITREGYTTSCHPVYWNNTDSDSGGGGNLPFFMRCFREVVHGCTVYGPKDGIIVNDRLPLDAGDHPGFTATRWADRDVNIEYPFQALCPSHGLAALFGCFVFVFLSGPAFAAFARGHSYPVFAVGRFELSRSCAFKQ
jgi:hypothetical protein